MKKTIIGCVIFIGLGFLIGNKFQERQIEEPFYFLREGVYENKNVFEENVSKVILNGNEVKDFDKKIMEYKNNKIYIYTAITKDINLAKKIQEIYKKQKISLKIEEISLPSEELSTNIKQFDLLMKNTKSEEEILKIQEVVIANYEEIMKNQENL